MRDGRFKVTQEMFNIFTMITSRQCCIDGTTIFMTQNDQYF